MVREILNKTVNGIKLLITVPDSATREDEVKEFIYWIKYYKTVADRVKQARKRLQEIAKEDRLVEWLLYDEGYDSQLEDRAGFFDAIAFNLLKEFMDYVSADELIGHATDLFNAGMNKAIEALIKAIEEGTTQADGEADTDGGGQDGTD